MSRRRKSERDEQEVFETVDEVDAPSDSDDSGEEDGPLYSIAEGAHVGPFDRALFDAPNGKEARLIMQLRIGSTVFSPEKDGLLFIVNGRERHIVFELHTKDGLRSRLLLRNWDIAQVEFNKFMLHEEEAVAEEHEGWELCTLTLELMGPPLFACFTKDVGAKKGNSWIQCCDFTRFEANRWRQMHIICPINEAKGFEIALAGMDLRSSVQYDEDIVAPPGEDLYWHAKLERMQQLARAKEAAAKPAASKSAQPGSDGSSAKAAPKRKSARKTADAAIIDSSANSAPDSADASARPSRRGRKSAEASAAAATSDSADAAASPSVRATRGRTRKTRGASADGAGEADDAEAAGKVEGAPAGKGKSTSAQRKSKRPKRADAEASAPEPDEAFFSNLPTELWLRVFSFFGPAELCRAGQVSRLFHYFSVEPYFWRRFCTPFRLDEPMPLPTVRGRKKIAAPAGIADAAVPAADGEDAGLLWKHTYKILSRIRCTSCGGKGATKKTFAARMLGLVLCEQCKKKEEYAVVPLTHALKTYRLPRAALPLLRRATTPSMSGVYCRYFMVSDVVSYSENPDVVNFVATYVPPEPSDSDEDSDYERAMDFRFEGRASDLDDELELSDAE